MEADMFVSGKKSWYFSVTPLFLARLGGQEGKVVPLKEIWEE